MVGNHQGWIEEKLLIFVFFLKEKSIIYSEQTQSFSPEMSTAIFLLKAFFEEKRKFKFDWFPPINKPRL